MTALASERTTLSQTYCHSRPPPAGTPSASQNHKLPRACLQCQGGVVGDAGGVSRFAVLSDEQWARVAPLLPSSVGKKSRPFRDHRQVVEGIIYRYRTGIPWRDLPREQYGPWQTLCIRGTRDVNARGPADRERQVVRSRPHRRPDTRSLESDPDGLSSVECLGDKVVSADVGHTQKQQHRRRRVGGGQKWRHRPLGSVDGDERTQLGKRVRHLEPGTALSPPKEPADSQAHNDR